jgi:hypothetical protein
MKKKGGLYNFLDASGVLSTGNDVLIKEAKKQYWQQYKAKWRAKQRLVTEEITVVLTPYEAQLISETAKKYKRSKSAFVKATCLAYLQKIYVVTDILAVNSIKELLTMNYAALKNLLEDTHISYQVETTVLNQIAELERQVLDNLLFPASLENLVLDAIRHNPQYKETLGKLLQNT